MRAAATRSGEGLRAGALVLPLFMLGPAACVPAPFVAAGVSVALAAGSTSGRTATATVSSSGVVAWEAVAPGQIVHLSREGGERVEGVVEEKWDLAGEESGQSSMRMIVPSGDEREIERVGTTRIEVGPPPDATLLLGTAQLSTEMSASDADGLHSLAWECGGRGDVGHWKRVGFWSGCLGGPVGALVVVPIARLRQPDDPPEVARLIGERRDAFLDPYRMRVRRRRTAAAGRGGVVGVAAWVGVVGVIAIGILVAGSGGLGS